MRREVYSLGRWGRQPETCRDRVATPVSASPRGKKRSVARVWPGRSGPRGRPGSPAAPGSRSFSERAIELIRAIPRGKVSTYRLIAAGAGSIFAARQVAWLLHSSTRKHGLPWHRVINSEGRISLKPGHGYEVQRRLLRSEGVGFRRDGSIDLERYLWK